MKNATITSQQKSARIAGLIFLFIVIGWILNWTLIDSKLIVTGDVTKTINNIIANELLFRVSLTFELIFAICSLLLAFALFIILKPINKNISFLALNLKLVESIIAVVIVLITFITLQMLNGKAYLTIFKPEQMQDVIGLFINIRSSCSTISMVFLGLNFIVFFYLLFKSKYVPGVLSIFGIISYLLILVYSLISMIIPQDVIVNTISMIFFMPSIIFEITIGLWLLIKGVNIKTEDETELKSDRT
ncbi:MAG: hypothetical protein A2086_15780 [Spirochaetes bacterium GWD1_27_9]|nr:MAG: hypothetical protein A2Z98_11050 [Spirochaetes bacterium GWB1_27_13]OHD27094.1 MAG: hypothetical protein A2Y34_11390 [Spirochaetes bacterium GWC1_27_15]OHD42840.1 MAG: hypothetical protein A2086_15780 [Spirochaetes bacterium GWD1_27_9]